MKPTATIPKQLCLTWQFSIRTSPYGSVAGCRAQSWNGNALLQERLKRAVDNIDVPVLLIQPPKDPSLEPARVLAAEAARAHKTRFTAKIYPETMPEAEQGHCFGGARGFHNWADEAVAFFASVLK